MMCISGVCARYYGAMIGCVATGAGGAQYSIRFRGHVEGLQAMQFSEFFDRAGEELSRAIQGLHEVVWFGHFDNITCIFTVVHAFVLTISICVIKHGRYLGNFGERILQYASRIAELVQLQQQGSKLRFELNSLCCPYIVRPASRLIPIRNCVPGAPHLGQKIFYKRDDSNRVGSLPKQLLSRSLLVRQVSSFSGCKLFGLVDLSGDSDRNDDTDYGDNKARNGGYGLDNCGPFFRCLLIKNEWVQMKAEGEDEPQCDAKKHQYGDVAAVSLSISFNIVSASSHLDAQMQKDPDSSCNGPRRR